MNRLSLLGSLLLLSALACADTGGGSGCACGGDFEYPREISEAAPTASALRARVTDAGFESIGRSVPGMISAGCTPEGEDSSASCELSSEDPNIAKFYLGAPCAPMSSTTDLFLTSIHAEVRSGDCNGQSYHRSNLGMQLDSLEGNVHLNIIDDEAGPGIEMIFGCPHSNIGSCSDDEFVRLSMDMVWLLTGFGAQNACSFIDDPNADAGVIIQSAKVILRPRIELGDDLKPYLTMVPDTMDVNDLSLDFNIRQEGAIGDPACANDGCATWCTVTDWGTSVVETLMQSEFIATLLGDVLADSLLGSLGDQALEGAGELDLYSMLGFGNRRADPTAYLLTADLDSPSVTGASGNRGMNFDFGAGFFANYVPCVPEIGPSSWLLPQIDPPGAVIQAPNPETGELGWESFDLMFSLGDVLLERAAYNLFLGGSLCLNLEPEALETMSGGAFAPTVSLMSLLAPGLASLAGPDDPVTLALVPTLPLMVNFGTGEATGEDTVDSHIQLLWPQVELAIYPLIDDSVQRLLAFRFNLHLNISLVPQAGGELKIMLDQLELADVYESYNEIGTDFDPAAVADLIGVFLPALLADSDAFTLDLGPETIGMPTALKVRKITAEGDEKRHLAVYMKICAAADLADATNALCFAGAQEQNANLLDASDIRFDQNENTWEIHSLPTMGSFEYALRVDGRGPWRNFRAVDSGDSFKLDHPALRFPGEHLVEMMARPVGTRAIPVRRSFRANVSTFTRFSAKRVPEGVYVHAWTQNGETVQVPVQLRLTLGNGEHELFDGVSGSIIGVPASGALGIRLGYPGAESRAWRMLKEPQESLNEGAELSQNATPESGGCSAALGTPWWVAICCVLLHRTRRSRQRNLA